jgi:flavin-dependent dehydrogenase
MQGIKIIGAGLAGLSTAIFLKKGGVNTHVFERNRFIGENVIENFQAIRNYDKEKDFLSSLKDRGICLSANPIKTIDKYAPSGKRMSVTAEDKPLFYSIKRGSAKDSIDNQLFDLALKEGVNFSFGDRKTLGFGDIISTGPLFKNMWAFGEVYYDVDVDPSKIILFMDNNYCPQGYIYIIPFSKNKITIAATSFDLSSPLPAMFHKFVNENRVMREIVDDLPPASSFTGFAYSNIPESAVVKGKKFVGGAAGFVDPARGFGISYAVDSGYYAAKSCIDGSNYDSLWKQGFEKEFLDGLRRRLLIEKMTNEDYEKFVLGEKISIKQYQKIPSSLKGMLSEVKFNKDLAEWRKRYDLAKLFS